MGTAGSLGLLGACALTLSCFTLSWHLELASSVPSQAQSLPLPAPQAGPGGYMWGLSHGRRPWARASPSQLSLPARGLPAAMRGRGGLAELARGLLSGCPRARRGLRAWPGPHPQLAVLGRGGRRESRGGRIIMMIMPVARAAHLGHWHAGASESGTHLD
jgi:hypothetical protein